MDGAFEVPNVVCISDGHLGERHQAKDSGGQPCRPFIMRELLVDVDRVLVKSKLRLKVPERLH